MTGVNMSGICRILLLLGGIAAAGSAVSAHPDAVFHQPMRLLQPAEPIQKWDYVTVRKDAHMFWWLYHTTAVEGYKNRPLIIWLQGGPGGSSTGFGNFLELGPLDVNLDARNTTWVSQASVLFIDNPVGTGYSYVTSDEAYTTDVTHIADDLLVLLKAFMKSNPDFQNIPLYIFCESYGGKMTAAFAQTLYKAVKANDIQAKFKGVALGDSWISPVDYVMTWGPYLYATSLVDEESLSRINATAVDCKTAFEKKNYTGSTALWGKLEVVIETETSGVNYYNILKWGQGEFSNPHQSYLEQLYHRHVSVYAEDALSDLMNGLIRQKLGIIPANVTWGSQSGNVFRKQSVDFMKSVVDIVDDLLNSTDLQVVVYNGQLDLICDTMGTEKWVQRLKWSGLPDYNKAKRNALKKSSGVPWGFLKQYKNFSFYWILDAGHMVPQDVGDSALKMVQMVIGQ